MLPGSQNPFIRGTSAECVPGGPGMSVHYPNDFYTGVILHVSCPDSSFSEAPSNKKQLSGADTPFKSMANVQLQTRGFVVLYPCDTESWKREDVVGTEILQCMPMYSASLTAEGGWQKKGTDL